MMGERRIKFSPRKRKLSDDDVRSIRAKSADKCTLSSIAKEFNVSVTTISNIVHGRSKFHVV